MIRHLRIEVERQGLNPITKLLQDEVRQSGLTEGVCHLFIQHTSASLLIQEDYDPSAREDLEGWMARLVPEGDPGYTHTLEGPDDMPAHIKSALTGTSLTIPVVDGRLALGSWQGVFLFEHRRRRSVRNLVMHLGE